MIFISYSSSDEQIAKKLNEAFKKQNVQTWFACESIGSGESYAKKITNAIRESACVVLLFSANVNGSVHIPRELDLAIKNQKQIFPIRIEECEPQEELEYFLSTVQWFDAFESLDQKIDRFVLNILNNLGLLYDNRKYINESTIDDFCIQHFKLMGYKIALYNKESWKSVPQVQDAIKKEPSKEEIILEYLDENSAIYAYKEESNKRLIVIPKYIEKATTPYFKALEASYFFEAKDILFTTQFKDKVKETYKDIDFYDEYVDFKKRSMIVEYFRKMDYNQKRQYSLLPIVFYQFVKNPPKYKGTNYTLPFAGKYSEGEKLSNLFLNFSMFPNWWAAQKDKLENIRGAYYENFTDAYKTLLYTNKFKHISHKENIYNHYNGRLAETIAEVFFNKNNLLVQNFGVEHVVGNTLNFINRSQELESLDAKKVVTRFMSSPDLLIIKLNDQNQMVNSFFFDVKYRTFASQQEFLESLTQNNDLYKHAKKYHLNWDEVYLFLFAHFKNEHKTEIYILNVGEISRVQVKNPPTIKKDSEFHWLNDKSIDDLYKYANLLWS